MYCGLLAKEHFWCPCQTLYGCLWVYFFSNVRNPQNYFFFLRAYFRLALTTPLSMWFWWYKLTEVCCSGWGVLYLQGLWIVWKQYCCLHTYHRSCTTSTPAWEAIHENLQNHWVTQPQEFQVQLSAQSRETSNQIHWLIMSSQVLRTSHYCFLLFFLSPLVFWAQEFLRPFLTNAVQLSRTGN